jgi:hypothetical protein
MDTLKSGAKALAVSASGAMVASSKPRPMPQKVLSKITAQKMKNWPGVWLRLEIQYSTMLKTEPASMFSGSSDSTCEASGRLAKRHALKRLDVMCTGGALPCRAKMLCMGRTLTPLLRLLKQRHQSDR